jgi:FG-GAP-like repeat
MDSTLTVLRNNGAGNFTEPATSPESTGIVPEQPAAADFDLDGDQDLAVANAFTNNVTVLRNAGHANFAQPPTSPEPVGMFPGGMTAADLDGDGDSDLAVGNVNSDNVTILRNR